MRTFNNKEVEDAETEKGVRLDFKARKIKNDIKHKTSNRCQRLRYPHKKVIKNNARKRGQT